MSVVSREIRKTPFVLLTKQPFHRIKEGIASTPVKSRPADNVRQKRSPNGQDPALGKNRTQDMARSRSDRVLSDFFLRSTRRAHSVYYDRRREILGRYGK